MKLRIKFRKFGAVRFIGHLDVMRFFQKALRRAEIDVAYTSGYSPHQIMSFAAPLSVGLTSDGEYMDIEVNFPACHNDGTPACDSGTPLCDAGIFCNDVKVRLNQVSVPGIEIVGVNVLPENSGNAMASVAAAAYTVLFRSGKEPQCSLEKILPEFLAREEIIITKAGKKGERQINIRPGIYDLKYFSHPSPETGCSQSAGGLHMLVDASSSGNIKPAQVVGAMLAQNGESLAEHALLINRDDTFINIGTDENPEFVPLDFIRKDVRDE